jgi:hypothetical protein
MLLVLIECFKGGSLSILYTDILLEKGLLYI